MASSNEELSVKLQNAGAAVRPTGFGEIMKSWYAKYISPLTDLCGTKEEARKLYVAAMTHITRSPILMQCTPESLQSCIMQSATLKLYPGAYQECAYVPYKNQATFQPMFQGLVKLALNGSYVLDVNAGVVYSEDQFDYQEGTNPYINHKRKLATDRGQRVAAYAVATLRNNGKTFVILSKDEIESIKARSSAVKSGRSSPWDTDEDEMWKKTAIKRICKLFPKSTELAQAIEMDNAEERPDLAKNPIIEVPSVEDTPQQEVVNVTKQ